MVGNVLCSMQKLKMYVSGFTVYGNDIFRVSLSIPSMLVDFLFGVLEINLMTLATVILEMIKVFNIHFFLTVISQRNWNLIKCDITCTWLCQCSAVHKK